MVGSASRWRATLPQAYGCVGVVAVLSACGPAGSHEADDVASLSLTCRPAARGVHCRLLALFHDVRRPPRDVTADASWRLAGLAGARMSAEGVVEAPTDGDVKIDAQYDSHHAHAWVRLARNHPGQVLGTLRGLVYAETDGILRPMAHVRVVVVDGPSAGLSTTTLENGSYEFVGIVPGNVMVRATKIGYTAADGSTQLQPGDNRLSLLIEALPPNAASIL